MAPFLKMLCLDCCWDRKQKQLVRFKLCVILSPNWGNLIVFLLVFTKIRKSKFAHLASCYEKKKTNKFDRWFCRSKKKENKKEILFWLSFAGCADYISNEFVIYTIDVYLIIASIAVWRVCNDGWSSVRFDDWCMGNIWCIWGSVDNWGNRLRDLWIVKIDAN